jgi:hypothetical protein
LIVISFTRSELDKNPDIDRSFTETKDLCGIMVVASARSFQLCAIAESNELLPCVVFCDVTKGATWLK